MSEPKVIKSPEIKDEVCYVEIPESILASVLESAVVEEEMIEETIDETIEEKPEEENTPVYEEINLEEKMASLQAEAEKIITEAQEEAQRIILSSREEAGLILKNTGQEIERLRKEAEVDIQKKLEEGYETGYQEGLDEGRKKAQEEWEEKLTTAEETIEQSKSKSLAIIKKAEEERIERIISSEEEILKLACDIAEKITRAQIEELPETWLEMIRQAVRKVAGANELTIRVSQEDEPFLIQHIKEIQNQLSESPMINVVSDVTLKPGDLIVQSNLGQVDARIQEQVSNIFKILKKEGN